MIEPTGEQMVADLGPPVTLPHAILWLYEHLPDEEATSPQNDDVLNYVEEYLIGSGLMPRKVRP